MSRPIGHRRLAIADEERGQKAFTLLFDPGDEFVSELTGCAKDNDLTRQLYRTRRLGRCYAG